MKTSKKHKKTVPAVHIQGDLDDVKKLVEVVSKKKSVVIFRNSVNDTCYVDIEKNMVEYTKTDIARLEKDFRVIYFDFFPKKKSIKTETIIKPVAAKSPAVKKKNVKAPPVKKITKVKTKTARPAVKK
jgi:hypothetical protein